MKKSILSCVLAGVLGVGCGGDESGQASAHDAASAAGDAAVTEKLDCGSTTKGSKQALRAFLSVLRSGDEAQILSVLAKRGRFEWIFVGRDGTAVVNVRGDRRKAAREVAESGGLPLRIRRFMNAEKPRRTTDFGFFALWNGRRGAVGKAALDCEAGTARVLSVQLRP